MISELPRFSREEVAKHNQENDSWIIINHKVYDVTKFLKLHPGGKGVLLKVAGTDCTKVFYALHEHAQILKFEKKLLIGLVTDETPMQMLSFGKDVKCRGSVHCALCRSLCLLERLQISLL